jgi:hypothetical protein
MKGDVIMKIDKGAILGIAGLVLTVISYGVGIMSGNHQQKVLKEEIKSDILKDLSKN